MCHGYDDIGIQSEGEAEESSRESPVFLICHIKTHYKQTNSCSSGG